MIKVNNNVYKASPGKCFITEDKHISTIIIVYDEKSLEHYKEIHMVDIPIK